MSYEDLRLKVSGVFPSIELHAALRRVHLEMDVRQNSTFQRMLRVCNLCISYVNDFFSYRKEALAGESSNIVMILLRESPTFEVAMTRAVGLHDGYVAQFYACEQSLRAQGLLHSNVAAYIRIMELWMRGNFDWSAGKTNRYLEASSTSMFLDDL